MESELYSTFQGFQSNLMRNLYYLLRARLMWLDSVRFCINEFIRKGMLIPSLTALEVSIWLVRDRAGDLYDRENSFQKLF